MTENEAERYSHVAADAVAAGLRLARAKIPEASDARLLLLFIGNVAACLGRLRVEQSDVQTIVARMYQQGEQMEPVPGRKFDLD